MVSIVSYVLIGLAAGLLSGFFGVGGGVLIVPALMIICGFSQLKAQGTSLAILLPPTGIMAFLQYYKRGNVDIKAGIIICVMVVLGSMISSRIVQNISPVILRKGFSIFMVLVAAKLFFSK
jgi:uncharacterized protein